MTRPFEQSRREAWERQVEATLAELIVAFEWSDIEARLVKDELAKLRALSKPEGETP